MSYRVVIPRSIPFGDSNRVQREVWKRGYGTRSGGRDPQHPGRTVVEFLRVLEELPDPGEVSGLAHDLETVLASKRVDSDFVGTGAWLETVQRPPRRHPRAS